MSTRSDTIGGSNVHIRDLAAALTAAGHEAVVLGGGDGPWADAVRSLGVRYVPLRHLARPIRPPADLLAASEVRRAVQAERPDIVSLHTAKAGAVGRIALIGVPVPIIYTAHGWTFTDGVPRSEARLYRAIERVLAPLASVIIDVCAYERDLAMRNGVGRADQHIVVYNGMPNVDGSLLADPSVDPPKLVMVARFEVPKDHTTLLRALAGLTHLPWRLEFVGDGPLRPSIESEVQRLGLSGRVTLLGRRTDVGEVLRGAQLLVLSSRWEGFPRTVLEGMRAGLPVVASAVGGVAEAIIDGVTGYMVPPNQVESLSDRLSELLADAQLRNEMGRAGRKRYLERFTFERMFGETQAVYERLMESVAQRGK